VSTGGRIFNFSQKTFSFLLKDFPFFEGESAFCREAGRFPPSFPRYDGTTPEPPRGSPRGEFVFVESRLIGRLDDARFFAGA
jgi:hypothetical protein